MRRTENDAPLGAREGSRLAWINGSMRLKASRGSCGGEDLVLYDGQLFSVRTRGMHWEQDTRSRYRVLSLKVPF